MDAVRVLLPLPPLPPLRWLLAGLWMGMFVCTILAIILPPLRHWSLYGKLRMDKTKILDSSGWSLTRLLDFTVPKKFFTHYYVVATIWVAVLNYLVVLPAVIGEWTSLRLFLSNLADQSRQELRPNSESDGIIMMLAVQLHVVRRLLECLFLSRFSSKARMHVLGYAVGIVFYVLLPLSTLSQTALVSLDFNFGLKYAGLEDNMRGYFNRYHSLGLLLFIGASFRQHMCHRVLANLRPQPSGAKGHASRFDFYSIPHGDWFDAVSSPHYLFELVIYLSFIVMSQGVNLAMWCTLIFSVANLSITAHRTHSWYQKKFDDYPRQRKALIPYLW